MNVKGKKVILIDEVAEFLNQVENENNYEKEVNSFLKKNYTILNLEDTKTFIEIVNKFTHSVYVTRNALIIVINTKSITVKDTT